MNLPTKSRFERQDPPEIAALRRLRQDQPELALAVDMQIDIVTLQRRIQSRLSTPWVTRETAEIDGHLARGHALLRFEDVAFDWVELRVLFRQIADVLLRFEIVEASDHATLMVLARDSHPTPDEVRAWFEARLRREHLAGWVCPRGEAFQQVLDLCARPFIERAAESLRARTDLTAWHRPYCPLCGSDPEMASLGAGGDRRLHCGACATAWVFDSETCPSCESNAPRRQASYASADGRYRLLACNVCKRYLKAVDGRRLERPIMLSVDTIATLPLDAAAMQKGYAT